MALIVCRSPINIALVKYWGKIDSKDIIPANDSFSITISKEHLCSRTELRLNPENSDITLLLNGKPATITARILNVVQMIRARAPKEMQTLGVDIVSTNNFNTAAGMASSSSGLSCLAFALF